MPQRQWAPAGLQDRVVNAAQDLDVTILYAPTVQPFDAETLRETLIEPQVIMVEPYLAGGRRPRSPGRWPTSRIDSSASASVIQTYICTVAGEQLLAFLRQLYGHGWLPAELVRQARFRVDGTAGGPTRWMIAAERWAAGLERIDPHWRQQFEDADPPSLSTADDWITQWARSSDASDQAAVLTLVRLLEALVVLPSLELLVPPPEGIPTHRQVLGKTPAETNPILAKVAHCLPRRSRRITRRRRRPSPPRRTN